VVAALGLWMRQAIPETLPHAVTDTAPRGVRALGGAILQRLHQVAEQWRLVLRVIGLVSFANVIFYLAFVFLVDATGQRLGNSATANGVATLLQGLGLPLVVLGGHLADRHGLVAVNRWGNLALILVMPAALLIGQQRSLAGLITALALLLPPMMITMGAQGVLGVVLIPPRHRCAVFSIAYSLAMALFAGSAPLLATWLLERQHWPWATPLYALVHGLLALWAIRSSRALLR
jgi:MHS family proline/betaine transporter-like MFS transporter